MAFNAIDPTTPAGTEKTKFGDDRIREFKAQTIDNFKEVSNYPATTRPALRTAVWSTAQRPSGAELVDKVTGYNTDLGAYEYYDLAATSWKVIATPGLSAWTVAGRPTIPFTNQYGYNTDLAVTERWDGTAWKRISGGRRGDIKMWSGSVTDLEAGWILSDGVERDHPEGGKVKPPDLRDRFLIGAGLNYTVGLTGGEAFHTLTIAEMPSHNHTLSGVAAGNSGGPDGQGWRYWDGPGATNYSGGGAAHENRPPFYALCYLYKL